MLDFRIETFLCLCETLNYRKSAEILHLTQPAVTKHIQYLESFYGCKLFTYKNRKLKKTSQGEALEKYSRSMKLSEENLKRQIKNGSINELNVGATKTIGECVIGEYAENFISYPENKLSLTVDNTEKLLTMINNCELDFALVEGDFDRTEYGFTLFRKEDFVGICSEDHPFAGKEIEIERLFSETFICREEGSGTRAIIEEKLHEFNKSISFFSRTVCISSFNMILDFVRKNYGISFVYKVLADFGNLSTFTLQNCKIQKEFNFVYLKDTGAEEKINHFMQKNRLLV